MMRVVWLQSGGCGGCTLSLLGADVRDFHRALGDAGVELAWHPSLSLASGAESLGPLAAWRRGEASFDVLAVEGALLRGPHGSGAFHRMAGSGEPMIAWVRDLAARARHVLAIGSCAAWGGMSAAGLNPTDACGLQYEDDRPGGLLGAGFRSASGLPVVNVAGCPTHPGWVLDTLAALATDALHADDLDPLARPRFYADQLVHHGCTRNEYYEFKASAEKPSDLGCLMEHLGCKGTQAHADCNTRLWNGEGSAHAAALPASAAPSPVSRTRATASTTRPSWPASRSACRPTCPRPGSSPLPRCPRARRRGA
jgi:NiFe hydrogenase small subunit HydA